MWFEYWICVYCVYTMCFLMKCGYASQTQVSGLVFLEVPVSITIYFRSIAIVKGKKDIHN